MTPRDSAAVASRFTWDQWTFVRSRSLARSPETPLHAAADRLAPRLSVTVRYALAVARKTLRASLVRLAQQPVGQRSHPDLTKTLAALRTALEQTLRPSLLALYRAGGEAGGRRLMEELRAAEFNPEQPRDERGQWTDGGGEQRTTVFHGTAKAHLDSILKEGVSAKRAGLVHPTLSDKEHVYVTTDKVAARHWAAATKATSIAVLEIQLPSDVSSSLVADTKAGNKPINFKFKGDIKPDWIKGVDALTFGEGKGWVKVLEAKGATYFVPVVLDRLRTAKDTPRTVIDFKFNARSENAISWADRHAAELIDGITETTRERINNAVAEYLESGNFADYYDEILDAVGSGDRADLIARNESMIAVHEGQREAWDQAVYEDVLTGKEVREWIVVGDGYTSDGTGKVCPICEGLEGKTARLGHSYISDEGEAYVGPPAHVSCRCSEGLIS